MPDFYIASSRTLTGAWIETLGTTLVASFPDCRTLTGAWIETAGQMGAAVAAKGRTLTGAWIETIQGAFPVASTSVAPSRVRGLKRPLGGGIPARRQSHPHGCVD